MRSFTRAGRSTLLCLLALPTHVAAEDWPQFLGPRRDGTSTEHALVEGWLRGGLVRRWSAALGAGYSGIVTQGAAIFTMDSDGASEFVVSLSALDGRERWRVRTGPSPTDVYGGLGPRVTPAVDGSLLFTVSGTGRVFALRVDSGQVVWMRDLAGDIGWRPPAEGAASSPLVADGRIYVMSGASGRTVAALDRATGELVWTAIDDRVSYSSPLHWTGADVEQILFLTGTSLFSLDPETGRSLWSYPWPTHDQVNVATPLPGNPDHVFISSGHDQGAALLRVERRADDGLEVEEVWRNREMKNHFNNSVYFERAYFGFDNAILKAVDAATGQSLWNARGFGEGSLVRVGAYLIVLSDAGELACGLARRDAFKVEARLSALGGRTWTPPSIANGSLYLRGERQVVRLSPPSGL
jgi:outer membrane protein assembly factor BamB